MRTLTKLSLTVLTCSILAACGSSSGSSSSKNLDSSKNIVVPTPNPKPGTKPAPTPDTKPAPTPDTKPAPTPDTKPAPTPDTKPAPIPDTKPVPTPDTKPVPTPDTKPAPTPDTKPAPTPDTKPAPTPDTKPVPTPDAKPAPEVTTNSETGGSRKFDGTSNRVSEEKFAINNADLEFLNVNGEKIRLDHSSVLPNHNHDDWMQVDGLEVCCGKYSDVRFGAIKRVGEGENSYLYYNGNPTKVMPTDGIVNYTGHSLMILGTEAKSELGTAKFEANFSTKKLDGTLEFTDKPVTIAITSDIDVKNNRFTGTGKSTNLETATVEGKFYGENAKELGGMFKGNDGTWGGVFGASK